MNLRRATLLTLYRAMAAFPRFKFERENVLLKTDEELENICRDVFDMQSPRVQRQFRRESEWKGLSVSKKEREN
jgi:hypothetical protein